MSKRGKGMPGALGAFLRLYQRKAQRHVGPNDRRYDEHVEKIVKSMAPWRLYELMYDDASADLPSDIEERWFARAAIADVEFFFGDSVSVVAGTRAGTSGCVVALLSLLPEPLYLVELSDNANVIKASQAKLRKK